MTYIDGYLIPVQNNKKDDYFAMAEKAKDIFLEHGALRVVETWGDNVPRGTVTDFYRAVAAYQDDGVVFSWVEWPDKATRDIGFEKVMNDERMNMEGDSMPFDGKRLIFGGFAVMVDGS
jgi:uncharacterized protein YbaA (DUF1428 family)